MPAATGFLRARFVDHQSTAFDIHAVEFSNGPCRVIFRAEFDKSETLRSAGIPIGDHSGRDRLVAPLRKQLQQALIGDAVRQTSYVKLCHMQSFVLIESIVRHTTKTWNTGKLLQHGMLFVRLMHSVV